MASSSESQPNSAASFRRTVSMFGSRICHMWYTGAWFEMSRYRLNASCTTRGLGQQPPLFRLMIVRSSVNACWISRQ